MVFYLSSLMIAAESADAAAGDTTSGTFLASIVSILPLIVVLVLMYLFVFRPQKKKDQEQQTMRETVEIGDRILTVGGIIGIIIRKNDDSVVIETGGDRTRLRIKKWAIHENLTAQENAQQKNSSVKKSDQEA